MSPESQSWTAAAIVVFTLAAFAWRWMRTRNRPGRCASGCGCAPKRPRI
ncbi:MAG: hypothetical protein ACKV19_24415 [Verrucomicrobiales bacterium]